MNIPWWKRLDITQAAAGIMTLKVLLPLSGLFKVPDIVDTALLCFALFLMAFSFNGRKIPSLKLLFGLLILCAISAYTCLVIDDFSILITVLSLAVLCFYDTHSFVRVIFWVSATFCAVHVLAFIIALLMGNPAPFFLASGSRNLLNFGTAHPNTFGSLMTSLVLMFLWLYGENYRGLKLLICLAVQYAVYLATDSRAALLANVITIFLLAWTYIKPPKKLLQIALCTVIPLLTISVLILIRLYLQGSDLAFKVNKLLSNRIMLGACAYEHFGLTLFGRYIPFHKEMLWDPKWRLTSFTFDNVYSYLLIQGGIFWAAILSWLFCLASRRLRPKDMVFLLSWALYALCENTVLNGYTLFPIFLLANICKHKATKPAPSPKRQLSHRPQSPPPTNEERSLHES